MSFRRRSYPEVLENLLTTVSGGVAAESQPFPPEGASTAPFRMPLVQTQPRDVIAVYGIRNGASHRFRKGTDFVLDANSIVWPDGAELPDAGTLVQVNYFGAPRPGPVTDINTGSVVRTLLETVAVEMAGLYAQMEAVYESAFIDTAAGRSLDNVVALLGIERVRSGRATTQIEFTRAPGTVGEITIPAGTRVIDEAGEVEYATTEDATLPPEQKTVRAFARDLEANDPVAADTLIVLPVPIAGIVKITNPGPALIGTRDETDDELRARAKSFLHGSERATLGALRQAIARQGGGITADIVEDPVEPGFVTITPHAESLPPTLQQRLAAAVLEARPAGVKVNITGPQAPQKVNLELRLTTLNTLLEQDLRAAHEAVKTKVSDYFAKLAIDEPASVNKLVGLALSVPGVEDVRILSAALANGNSVINREAGLIDVVDAGTRMPKVLGALRVADPNLATSVLVNVTYPDGEAPPDAAQITGAIEEALAYVNGQNASEPDASILGDVARRTISYGKLLLVTPLPGHFPGDLDTHDDAVAAGGAPLLLDAAGILPYRVSYVFTQAAGVAARLTQSSHNYQLTPFERLTLGGVQVAVENGNA